MCEVLLSKRTAAVNSCPCFWIAIFWLDIWFLIPKHVVHYIEGHISEMLAEAADVLAAELAECLGHLRNVRMTNAHRVAEQRKRVRALDDDAEAAPRPSSEIDEAAQELLALRDAETQVKSAGARLGRIV